MTTSPKSQRRSPATATRNSAAMIEPVEDRVLVADVGGTNCRMALARMVSGRPELEALRVMPTPRSGFALAVREYLELTGCGKPAAIAVAAAGRVRRQPGRTWVAMTNTPLGIDRESLSALAHRGAHLVNDLAAVAAALPWLTENELALLGPAHPTVPGTRLVVGVGTGFGAAALSSEGAVIDTEAGHADLAAVTAEEKQYVERLARAGRLTVEEVLSGPGLLRLYEALSGHACEDVRTLLARRAARDAIAIKTLTAFSTWLGRAVGNLVLGLGAWGGVYLIGGVVSGLGDALDADAFRRGMEDKEPFGADLGAVPVRVVLHSQPALLGMAGLALTSR